MSLTYLFVLPIVWRLFLDYLMRKWTSCTVEESRVSGDVLRIAYYLGGRKYYHYVHYDLGNMDSYPDVVDARINTSVRPDDRVVLRNASFK